MRALLIVAALASVARGNECGVDGRTPLAGWTALPPPTASSPLRQCAQDSPCEYRIETEGKAVFVVPDAPTPKAPAGVPKAADAFCFDWQRIDGGWLAACDAGLSLFAPDGKRTVLDARATTQLLTVEGGFVALAGKSGAILRVRKFGGAYTATTLASLGSWPYTALVDGTRLLVATPAGLADVALDGARPLRWLRRAPWPSPASISVAGDTIYVAMSYAVVRLTKTPAGYVEHWLVPHGCERPAPDRCDCRTPHK